MAFSLCAGSCVTCLQHTRERTLHCNVCHSASHPSCLGLGKHSYPADSFTCASCVCVIASLPSASVALDENAHKLVWLRAQNVQSSSQTTYASSLARFTYWAQEVADLKPFEALPPHPVEGVVPARVELFIAWAASKYAYATIESTITALADWHRSKQLDPAIHVRTAAVKQLLKNVKNTQGPSAIPTGKVGMSRDLLRLTLSHLGSLARSQPDMRTIHQRDIAWLLVGYFGMLRRSEIIALQMRDIQFMERRGKPSHIELTIRRSKTDRRGQGATLTITSISTDGIPIYKHVQAWFALRLADRAPPTSPLFTSWDMDGKRPSNMPIQNGQSLANRLRTHLVVLKRRFPELEINPSAYGMHSLRRGGVMAAWLAGVDIEKIKSHGRWRSDAVRAYMQANLEVRLVVTTTM